MPRVRTRKPPPDGWDEIEPMLEEIDVKMREAVAESHEDKEISRELYEYCIQQKIADGNLIAKWKKPGYENLCCLRCIQTRDTNFGSNCVCRVPKNQLEVERKVECVHCGCRGCGG